LAPFFLVLPRAPTTFIYRASPTWLVLVIVIAGIAVYYLLARSAEERRVTDGE
jgi:protein-S-isoprenylcysteine O-methyltransferase Ste14